MDGIQESAKTMVTIQSSDVVVPSEITPTSISSLSLCDQIKLTNHGSQLYIYANTRITDDSSFASAIHTLSTSLSKTLTVFHPFAGRLRRIHGGRFQLLCNAKGVLLVAATCNTELSFEDLCEFAPTYAVPKINYDVPIEDVPLLVAQVTRFPCGFITLGIAMCRFILDGTSLSNFISSWAKLARGESLDSGLTPLFDRSKLDSFKLNKPPRFEHIEFLPPPLWTKRDEVMQHELGTALMVLTKGQVQKLKNKASDFGSGHGRGFTSFEVISGHLWRCMCKVRYLGDASQPTRLNTLVNCRNRLRPSLPTAYFGNATFPTVTETCSFDDIMQKPLGYAVRKVSESIERMRDEYVRSALDYIERVEDMDLFRDTFYNSAGKGREDPNVNVVGWANFLYFETDFGWGKPVILLPGNINSNGKAFLLDTANGDGFVLAVCLRRSYVDALKKLFYEDIEKHASKL
ncbi:spermidine hydroxycinnamoyl transferase-like [Vigna radiata var. radiata]|uniref:Spermidine hydroxycinnamoyl transferase-like n=1 Tax=Vigna radiata var. radiata TaxID=3916 RepID=A0A1S3TBI0_VIGRR|nr:spermidine hydroxycinnamoyl transferase-like [Vigna radiata var. radiata]